MITIKIKDQDLSRYLAALEKVRASVNAFGMDEMQRRCAVDYYQVVVKNIVSKRRVSPAYVPRYRSWKYEHGWEGYPSPWRLRGDLVRSLTAFRNAGGGWYGGVPRDARAGGKSWFGKGSQGPRGRVQSVGKYGWVMEKGGSWPSAGVHPPRPVFEPSAREYASEGWQKRGREALDELKKAWA